MTGQGEIVTRRLVLRPFRLSDAPALHEILSEPEAMRFWGDTHRTLAETEAFVRATIGADRASCADFVITLGDRIVGKAGMWRAPEIGFFVHPSHQRRGIACEALNALIPWLFERYPLGELTADVDPRNAASLALLFGLGFQETHRRSSTMKIEGEWCDSVYLALPRGTFPG